MRRLLTIFLLSAGLLAGTLLPGQQLSGRVLGEGATPLPGAAVRALGTVSGQGVSTDAAGSYLLTLPRSGTYRIVASFVGYRADTVTLDLAAGPRTQLDFRLLPATSDLLVEVTDRRLIIERNLDFATERLAVEELRRIPTVLGETDVLRSLQLLPGMQTGAEGQADLHVRGGSPDQNLILMDGVPIYNPNHVFGFLSAFNPDAVAGVSFRRGGFPARYGGRLSSVVDVEMRGGSQKRTQKRISLGPLLAKASLDGPLGQKTTYLISGRRSLYDLLLSPGRARRAEDNNPQDERKVRYAFGFSDLNLKLTHNYSERDRLSLTGYWGRDRYDRLVNRQSNGLTTRTEEIQNWGNLVGALNYRRTWSDRLTQRTLLGYTNYHYETGDFDLAERGGEREARELFYRSGVSELNARTDLTARFGTQLTLRAGGGLIKRTFRTGEFDVLTQSNRGGREIDRDTMFGRPTLTTLETFAYTELITSLGDGLSLNAGLHLAGLNGGFWSVQPRLSLRRRIGAQTSVHFGFARMRQFLHLVVSGSLGLPNDIWVPAGDRVPPQDSWQASLGMRRKLGQGWNLEADAYYKRLTSTANYRPGRGIVSLAPWEELLTTGTGRAYGLETRLARPEGRLSGWLAYTLNWSWRTFEELNFGRPFPYRYDRRHDLRVVANYDLKPDRVLLNANFVYASGNPVTVSNNLVTLGLPFDPAVLGGTVEFQSFTAVNNYRLRPTHRLDLGITFRKRRGHRLREISAGVYNAYARRNPYYVNLRSDPTGAGQWRGRLTQVHLLRALPYLTYSIEW